MAHSSIENSGIGHSGGEHDMYGNNGNGGHNPYAAPPSSPRPPYPQQPYQPPYPHPTIPSPNRTGAGAPDAPAVLRPHTGAGFGWWLKWLLPPVAAHRLCRPSRRGRVVDPTTRSVQRMRSFAGFVVVAGIALAYNLTSVTERVLQPWIVFLQNCGLLIVLVPLVTGVFIRCARPHLRRRYLSRTRGPAAALGGLVGGALLLVLCLQLQSNVGTHHLPLLLITLWCMIFAFTALANSVTNVFRTADVHDTLPPLVSVVLVWSNMLIDLFTDTYADAPEGVVTVLLYGGPATVTLLALWELRRLRVYYGHTLRRALGR
ncbi:hypothetical protein ACIO3O_38235 [Streptomyces sp. NPDC087440]|uniref:hypothetical protein n=1 Tax=Streptomyces sp. NPDC087440 TaxID=3365790 RepID=UPI0038163030